jgi:hypothetical protein
MKSELLKCQNTDNPLTRMKIVDLPTRLLSFHRFERRIHTKRPHTSQHRAGIQNGSHDARHVAQYPEFSTHSLRKMSLTYLQARMTRDTPTESKIGDADHQPAKQQGKKELETNACSHLRRPPTAPSNLVQSARSKLVWKMMYSD